MLLLLAMFMCTISKLELPEVHSIQKYYHRSQIQNFSDALHFLILNLYRNNRTT